MATGLRYQVLQHKLTSLGEAIVGLEEENRNLWPFLESSLADALNPKRDSAAIKKLHTNQRARGSEYRHSLNSKFTTPIILNVITQTFLDGTATARHSCKSIHHRTSWKYT